MLTKDEKFLSHCSNLFKNQSRSAHDSFKVIAWEKFNQLGLPKKKSDPFQHVSLDRLFGLDFAEQTGMDHDLSDYDFILKDGELIAVNENQEDLVGLSVFTLKKAALSYGSYLNKRVQSLANSKQVSPFALLNCSLSQNGLFLYLKKGVEIKRPIRIAICDQTPQLFFFGDESSKATFIVQPLLNNNSFFNGLVDLNVEKNSQMTLLYDNHFEDNSVEMNHFSATVKRDSNLKVMATCKGSNLTRLQFDADLLGENGYCDFQAFAICKNKAQFHSHVQVNHKAPQCESNQLVKHLLFDQSKTSFTGKIYVDQVAQQTNAYQLNRNLLLSSDASAHSKPGLEIFADDVKASHGATIATIDDELMFYMLSRGISKKESRKFLIRAFAKEMIDAIFCEKIKSAYRM
ncbi:MAG: Fe-S cluster assembly protein SufD [Rhabdochlamydiaceae bacterium]|nr:Fe-S cluster assembly protein SufD [Candidatus Amphrikana amoebophyrae]